jgi:hypothetical protein
MRELFEETEDEDEVPPARLPPGRRLIGGGRKSDGFEEAEDAVIPDALGSSYPAS